MEIGGIQKSTLLDYPGKVACTIFTLGCNFRCPFCYSAELVLPEKIKEQPRLSEKEVFDFLESKKGLLEGVVICGGEPTLHEDLPIFLRKIKEMGFLVKLDSNGSNPEKVKKLIEDGLVDYVAMDVKAPKDRYGELIGGVNVDVSRMAETIEILKGSDIDFEFRTTVVPGLLKKEDVIKIARWIGPGVKYYLQNFRAEKTIDPKFEDIKPYPDEYMIETKKAAAPFVEVCEIRGID
jgi:pyruvate formate lyase activating enzyme